MMRMHALPSVFGGSVGPRTVSGAFRRSMVQGKLNDHARPPPPAAARHDRSLEAAGCSAKFAAWRSLLGSRSAERFQVSLVLLPARGAFVGNELLPANVVH